MKQKQLSKGRHVSSEQEQELALEGSFSREDSIEAVTADNKFDEVSSKQQANIDSGSGKTEKDHTVRAKSVEVTTAETRDEGKHTVKEQFEESTEMELTERSAEDHKSVVLKDPALTVLEAVRFDSKQDETITAFQQTSELASDSEGYHVSPEQEQDSAQKGSFSGVDSTEAVTADNKFDAVHSEQQAKTDSRSGKTEIHHTALTKSLEITTARTGDQGKSIVEESFKDSIEMETTKKSDEEQSSESGTVESCYTTSSQNLLETKQFVHKQDESKNSIDESVQDRPSPDVNSTKSVTDDTKSDTVLYKQQTKTEIVSDKSGIVHTTQETSVAFTATETEVVRKHTFEEDIKESNGLKSTKKSDEIKSFVSEEVGSCKRKSLIEDFKDNEEKSKDQSKSSKFTVKSTEIASSLKHSEESIVENLKLTSVSDKDRTTSELEQKTEHVKSSILLDSIDNIALVSKKESHGTLESTEEKSTSIVKLGTTKETGDKSTCETSRANEPEKIMFDQDIIGHQKYSDDKLSEDGCTHVTQEKSNEVPETTKTYVLEQTTGDEPKSFDIRATTSLTSEQPKKYIEHLDQKPFDPSKPSKTILESTENISIVGESEKITQKIPDSVTDSEAHQMSPDRERDSAHDTASIRFDSEQHTKTDIKCIRAENVHTTKEKSIEFATAETRVNEKYIIDDHHRGVY